MTLTKPLIYASLEAVLGLAGLILIWVTLGWWPTVAVFLVMFSMGIKSITLLELHLQEKHKK